MWFPSPPNSGLKQIPHNTSLPAQGKESCGEGSAGPGTALPPAQAEEGTSGLGEAARPPPGLRSLRTQGSLLPSEVFLGLSRQLDGRAPSLTCPITPDTSVSQHSSSSSSSSIHSPEGPCTRIRAWCHHIRLPGSLQRILTEGCARHYPALTLYY